LGEEAPASDIISVNKWLDSLDSDPRWNVYSDSDSDSSSDVDLDPSSDIESDND
jgi:hypothetical protein